MNDFVSLTLLPIFTCKSNIDEVCVLFNKFEGILCIILEATPWKVHHVLNISEYFHCSLDTDPIFVIQALSENI